MNDVTQELPGAKASRRIERRFWFNVILAFVGMGMALALPLIFGQREEPRIMRSVQQLREQHTLPSPNDAELLVRAEGQLFAQLRQTASFMSKFMLLQVLTLGIGISGLARMCRDLQGDLKKARDGQTDGPARLG